MLALICGAVAVNYLDRSLFGIATPLIQRQMHLSDLQVGWLLSAFSWTYFLSQVPSGILLDRISVRPLYIGSLLAWSGVTLLHALAAGFLMLIVLRLGLGLAEAPCFPANNKIVSVWFPRAERARAISLYTAAEYVGLGFLSPLLYLVLHHFGWRALFAGVGALGLIYGATLMRRYQDPDTHPHLDAAERELIRSGGGVAAARALRPVRLHDLLGLLRQRQLWGLCVGQFAVYSTFVFFLTWFPSYLVRERHMGWMAVGIYSSLPYLAGFACILVAGWWSDAMLRRGVALQIARKLPVIVGLVGASSIVAVNYIHDDRLAIGIMALAFFCQAMSSSGWSVIAEIAPKHQLGLIGGLFSASAALAGIVVPVVVGALIQATGSFVSALVFIGVVAALGAYCWIAVIGDLKQLRAA